MYFYLAFMLSMVGSNGIEPSTSRLSGVRSNHLSYEPILSRVLSSSSYFFCSSLYLLMCFYKTHWKINNKPLLWEESFLPSQSRIYFWKNISSKPFSFSLERRWSSRTFRYGYLVTTSPQSLILPSTAASFNSWLTGFGYSQLSWCDGRCVQGPGTYSRQYADLPLLAIPASWRRISAFNPNWDCFSKFRSTSRFCFSLLQPL